MVKLVYILLFSYSLVAKVNSLQQTIVKVLVRGARVGVKPLRIQFHELLQMMGRGPPPAEIEDLGDVIAMVD